MSEPDTDAPSHTLPKHALAALREALGERYVCTNADELARYSTCTSPWRNTCAAVVFPDSTEQVSRVLAIAASFGAPVWPYSTGRNWGYGATVAARPGAIVMILERMNRILEVNEVLAYAVIEPGVTYEQFNAHLKSKGHRLWVDCIDGTPRGSVIGNALERGVGETPYGDHFANLCGLEVVLADGSVVRTGGSMQELRTWHTHKWGVGPYAEGLFSQSNLGVVTRAGIWLMPEPESYVSYAFELHDSANVGRILDTFRELALQGVVTSKLHMINDFVTLTVLTQRRDEDVTPSGALTADDLARLRHKFAVSPWSCGGALYGSRRQVRVQQSILRKALSPYGRLLFLTDARLRIVNRLIRIARTNPAAGRLITSALRTSLPVLELAPHAHNVLKGIPTEYFLRHAYFRNRMPRPERDIDPARDQCGLVWFAPILPNTGAEIVPYLDRCRERFAAHGFDFYAALLMMNPRSTICLMAILFDKAATDEARMALELYGILTREMREAGYQQYRVGLGGWEHLLDREPELRAFNRKLKSALDPRETIAPMRYGVSVRP